MEKPDFITLIGASAGGLNAVCTLVRSLQSTSNVAFFFVMHASKPGIENFMLKRIQENTHLHCCVATHKDAIKGGRIYIAPANFHLIVKDGFLKLTKGAYENKWRPSIDVTFRSAAVAYRQNCIGIILSGLLDDGVSGMRSIQECGGATIIQNPEEAEFPDMPLAVQDSITVDHSSNLAGMGKIIDRIMKKDKRKSKTIPRQILIEAEVAEKVLTGIDKVSQLGEQSTFSCPDCGGMLFRIKEGNTDKYRCFTGHVYSQETLNIAQAENLDAALWVAIRIMEERYRLLKKMYNEENRKGMRITANLHQQRMEDLEKHIVTLKSMLFDTSKN